MVPESRENLHKIMEAPVPDLGLSACLSILISCLASIRERMYLLARTSRSPNLARYLGG